MKTLLCLLLWTTRESAATTIWKGIRYAEPVERWQAPVPYQHGWQHALDNRGAYDACPQDAATQSEDCLRLDIYKPDNAENLPIYIWIHGGHFKFGSGQWYGGQKFVMDDDIIYVTIQYRLGVFGFLNVKGTKYTGNYGLMDQQMAIKFIYDNAHQFGGDKNRITIGGESAGSISSSFHMLVPASVSMVKQAILQSGMPNAACGDWCPDIGWAIRQVCDEAEITCTSTGASTEQMVNQLREAPEATLIYHHLNGRTGVSINVNDGVFFPTDPWQTVRDRSFESDVNLLMGFTSYEGSLEKDSYPNKFNKDNFRSAYGEWPNDIYNPATHLDGGTIDRLGSTAFKHLLPYFLKRIVITNAI